MQRCCARDATELITAVQILRQHTNLGLFSNVNHDPSRPLTTFHDLARWKRKTFLIFILFIFHPYAVLVCGRSWAPEETSRNTLLYIVCYQKLSLTQRFGAYALPSTWFLQDTRPSGCHVLGTGNAISVTRHVNIVRYSLFRPVFVRNYTDLRITFICTVTKLSSGQGRDWLSLPVAVALISTGHMLVVNCGE